MKNLLIEDTVALPIHLVEDLLVMCYLCFLLCLCVGDLEIGHTRCSVWERAIRVDLAHLRSHIVRGRRGIYERRVTGSNRDLQPGISMLFKRPTPLVKGEG